MLASVSVCHQELNSLSIDGDRQEARANGIRGYTNKAHLRGLREN
ncbi:hypothetical protein [Nostoc sp.]